MLRSTDVELNDMPLYLTEADVEAVLVAGDAVEAVEASFRRIAAGRVENRPRYRLGLEDGRLAVMAASDLELGYAGAKVYARSPAGRALLRAALRRRRAGAARRDRGRRARPAAYRRGERRRREAPREARRRRASA